MRQGFFLKFLFTRNMEKRRFTTSIPPQQAVKKAIQGFSGFRMKYAATEAIAMSAAKPPVTYINIFLLFIEFSFQIIQFLISLFFLGSHAVYVA